MKRDISHEGAKEVIISEQPERELLWHKSWGSVQGNPNGLDRPERLSRINKGIRGMTTSFPTDEITQRQARESATPSPKGQRHRRELRLAIYLNLDE